RRRSPRRARLIAVSDLVTLGGETAGRQAKVAGLQDPRRREDHGAFDRVAELPQIAGPEVPRDGLFGLWGEAEVVAALPSPEEPKIVESERQDILLALPQGGKRQSDDIEPEEEIFAEEPGPDGRLQGTIGGGDD